MRGQHSGGSISTTMTVGSAASLAAALRREARGQQWQGRQLAGSVAVVVAVGIALAAQWLRSLPWLATVAPAAEAWKQRGGGGQLGSNGGSLASVRHWW